MAGTNGTETTTVATRSAATWMGSIRTARSAAARPVSARPVSARPVSAKLGKPAKRNGRTSPGGTKTMAGTISA